MKGLLLTLLVFTLAIPTAAQSRGQSAKQSLEPIVQEVEQTLVHYNNWLDSPAMLNVIKGTNHAARATARIDAWLRIYSKEERVRTAAEGRVGFQRIREVLLKQIRIHTDLLSTRVPAGIIAYDVEVENGIEEQLELLEQSLTELKRLHGR